MNHSSHVFLARYEVTKYPDTNKPRAVVVLIPLRKPDAAQLDGQKRSRDVKTTSQMIKSSLDENFSAVLQNTH